MPDENRRAVRLHSRRAFLGALGVATLGLVTACQQQTPAPAKPAEVKPTTAAKPAESGKPAAETKPAQQAPAQPTSGSTGAAKPASGKTVDKIILTQDIELKKMDPTSNVQGQSRNVYGHVFDSLIHAGPDGQPRPRVAESWEWRNENKVLRLKIRQGIAFHNGQALTAEDVKFSLDRYTDPKANEAAATFASIQSVEVADPATVDIALKEVDASFLARITDSVFVVPRAYHQEVGDNFNTRPVGSGPYTFKEWVRDDHMTLEANPKYWAGAVPVKQIVFRPIAEETTRVSALLSGDTDLIVGVPSTQAEQLKRAGTAELKVAPSPDLIYVGARPDHPILQDPKIRVAISHAINRQAIVDRLLGGYAKVVGTPLIPGMLGFDPEIEAYPYDPNKARQLLAEAGQPNGFEVSFDIPIGRVPRARDVAQAVAADLQAVGIKAGIQEFEINTYLNKLYRREGQIVNGLWLYIIRAPAYDPNQMFQPSFHTKGAWNWARYSDPKLDELIDKGVQVLDAKQREPIYRQAAQLAKESGYWTPLYTPQNLFAVRKSDAWSWEPRKDGLLSVWDDVKVS